MARRVKLSRFVKRVAREMGDEGRKAIVRSLQSSAIALQGRVVEEIDRAKPHPAVDRGELRNSVVVKNTANGAIVDVEAPHAPIIEGGTRPFFPPIAPIRRWVMRKGIETDPAKARGVAFAIAKKISETGIAPRGYFAKAWARFERYGVVTRELRNELKRVNLEI